MAPQPSDRVQVVDYPYGFPSKCVICGGGPETGRKFVDINAQTEDYGSIYFCDACVINVCNALDFVDPGTWNVLNEEMRKAKAALDVLAAENEDFRRVYSTLRGLGAVVPDNGGDGAREHVPDAPDDAKPEPKPKQPAKARKGTDKPSSVEGHRDVPEPDGDKPDGTDDLDVF